MLFHFRLFGSRKPRKPMHTARRVDPNAVSPDVSGPNYRIPTVHRARYEQQLHQAEQVNLKLRRYYNYRYQPPTLKDRDEIGEEVGEAMRLAEEPHEALTQAFTKPTRIIRNPFDPNQTQPLEED